MIFYYYSMIVLICIIININLYIINFMYKVEIVCKVSVFDEYHEVEVIIKHD